MFNFSLIFLVCSLFLLGSLSTKKINPLYPNFWAIKKNSSSLSFGKTISHIIITKQLHIHFLLYIFLIRYFRYYLIFFSMFSFNLGNIFKKLFTKFIFAVLLIMLYSFNISRIYPLKESVACGHSSNVKFHPFKNVYALISLSEQKYNGLILGINPSLEIIPVFKP